MNRFGQKVELLDDFEFQKWHEENCPEKPYLVAIELYEKNNLTRWL